MIIEVREVKLTMADPRATVAIIGGSGLQDKVFRLLQWAQMRGRLTELFQAAVDDDPKNKKLTDFIATL